MNVGKLLLELAVEKLKNEFDPECAPSVAKTERLCRERNLSMDEEDPGNWKLDQLSRRSTMKVVSHRFIES
jgi:hypothetical protein